MATVSVFNTAVPPGTQASPASNAGETIHLGMAFQLNENLTGWMCTGARLYVLAENLPDLDDTCVMRAFLTNDFSGSPQQTKTTGSLVAGWNNVTWDTPFQMPVTQGKVYITYQFGTTQRFLSSGIAAPSGVQVSSMSDKLQIPSAATGRSYYRLSAGSTTVNTDGVWYNVDILVAEGAHVYDAIEFVADRDGTEVTLTWDVDDDDFGVTILQVEGTFTEDGNGVAFGEDGYDPTTIEGMEIVSTTATSPHTITSLVQTQAYTFAVIRTGE